MGTFWHSLPRPILALAPMEGVTDSVFRSLARRLGADVVYTEFVSSDAIARRAPTALAKLHFTPDEQPVVCQIFGRDVGAFTVAAREIEARGFAGIDINFGCPARKVVGHGAGVSLMRDPDYCRRLIAAVVETVTIPVSIKVRASIRRERPEIDPGCQDRVTATQLVEAVRDLPVAAIMVHGRSYERGFSGPIDTAIIRQVKEQFSGVVLANGGIQSGADAASVLAQTGADGVGIARGALGNPWVFREIRQSLAALQGTPRTWAETQAIIVEHAVRTAARGPRALVEFRKHLAWYVTGRPGANRVRRSLANVYTVNDVQRLLQTVSN